MFPPELIDHVLSFLQWDHATLEVCAGAHPFLSELVERHLYRHLIIQNVEPYRSGVYRPLDLLKLIVNNPNIANHIRSLRIYVALFRDYHELESILPMLTQLRVLLLSSISDVWDDLRESFRTVFTNCLRLPTLTHVKLTNIDGFPLSALDHSSSLKMLSLSGDFCYIPPAPPIVFPPLDFLDLCHCTSTSMEIISSWLESHNLRSLQLRTSNLERSSRLLEVCANTLTTLIVHVPSVYQAHHNASSNDSTPVPLCLSYLPRLVRLAVQTPISFTSFHPYSRFLATMRLLDTLPSPPTNLVLLIIIVEIGVGSDDPFEDISQINWSALMSFPYFDVIPKVELRVQAHESGTILPSVKLLKTLKQDPQLMWLEKHPSFVINATEEPLDSWFDFGQIDMNWCDYLVLDAVAV